MAITLAKYEKYLEYVTDDFHGGKMEWLKRNGMQTDEN
jgi:hypothetical protein